MRSAINCWCLMIFTIFFIIIRLYVSDITTFKFKHLRYLHCMVFSRESVKSQTLQSSWKINITKASKQRWSLFKQWGVVTNRRHCRKIPPLDMFFSASSSPKLSELANTRTSAMLTSRCRNDTATSTGIPCVGSITSSSLWNSIYVLQTLSLVSYKPFH